MNNRRILTPLGVLLISLASTLVVAFLLSRGLAERAEQRFNTSMLRRHDSIVSHVATCITILRGAAGFLASEAPVTKESFRAYADSLDLRELYPGILGLGFSRLIHPEERASVIEEVRKEGVVRIDPVTKTALPFEPWGSAPTTEEHAILYLEPLGPRNHAAVGYNMYSEPVRRAAMERARDTGLPAATGKVTLIQEIDDQKQSGFLIYVPVYRGGEVPDTVNERREKLLGFAFSPFRSATFFTPLYSREKPLWVNFLIYDGDAATGELLHASLSSITPDIEPAKFVRILPVRLPGKTWNIVYYTGSQFEHHIGSGFVPIALGMGMVVSFLLSYLTWRETRARALLQAANEDKAALLESERAARSEAEKNARIKDDFLATLSHELRTPLSAVVGYVAYLRRGNPTEEDLKEGLEIIERNAKIQASLIEDLLDFNRIVSGKLRLEVGSVNIVEVIEAAVKTISLAAEAKGIRVIRHYPKEVALVRGDASRLQQVFWNLLSNAIKFTPSGGEVIVSIQGFDAHIEVCVEDTGQGMEPEFIPRVFERFKQERTGAARTHGGLGLGLAIVCNLVEMHGGSVSAMSEGLGKGAVFCVRLPVLGDEVAPIVGDDFGQSVAPDENVLDGVQVLVVDDERESCELVKRILEDFHAEVSTAGSVEEALTLLSARQPDILISDIGMPERDGYDLVRAIRSGRSENSRIPAIALTAFARPEDRQRSAVAGFQVHLTKPINPTELVAVVANLSEAGKRSQSVPAAD